jgi:uncharacterized caspase-like protein
LIPPASDLAAKNILRLLLGAFLLLFFALSGCASRSSNVALVVGLGAYTYAPNLPNPARDATAIGSSLDDLGWVVTTLTDLDHKEIAKAVADFAPSAAAAEQAVFFYAGHGMQIDGHNYLVPTGFKPTVAGLENLVSLDDMLAQLSEGNSQLVVFLDACRDNPLTASLTAQFADARTRGLSLPAWPSGPDNAPNAKPAYEPTIGRGLAETKVGAGSMIAYATQPGNVALDGVGLHSPFTEGLLEYIGTLGQDVSWVMRQTRGHVIGETDGKQVPWDHSSLIIPFYLNPRRTGPPPP